LTHTKATLTKTEKNSVRQTKEYETPGYSMMRRTRQRVVARFIVVQAERTRQEKV
jgi:hypothetical protein